MPILDLKVKISAKGDIHYQLYRKPMAQQLTLLERSAMSMRMKRTVMSQEVIRILRNTKTSLPWSFKAELLTSFAIRMKDSGYSEKVRYEVIRGGVLGYERQVQRDLAGQCPLYRPREWNREERDRRKKLQKVAWYRPAETVLFVPPSHRSELANKLAEETSNSRWRIRVVERAGRSLKQQLTSSDPLSTRDCGRHNCFVHSSGGKGDCRKPSVLYRHVCQAPQCTQGGKVVGRWGETGHNAFVRGKKHLDALKTAREKPGKADQDNGLVTHYMDCHMGEDPQFKMDVVEQFRKPHTEADCRGGEYSPKFGYSLNEQ